MAEPASMPGKLRSSASHLASRTYSSGVLDSFLETFGLRAPPDIDQKAVGWSALLEERYRTLRVRRWPGWRVQAYNEILYAVVRVTRPRVLLETGVEHGLSSSYLLAALRDNDLGTLHSIEIGPPGGWQPGPPTPGELPASEVARIGSAIPPQLRGRWNLHVGSAQDQLPRLLRELGKIDLFFHDSDHSEDHMLWEYRTAWEYLPEGGWLVSDDIDFNRAFDRFGHDVAGVPWRWIGAKPRRGLLRKGGPFLPPSVTNEYRDTPRGQNHG
ncbi:MAG: class I SAM-dependent methyltransferase [Thermoplasmata archaeon]